MLGAVHEAEVSQMFPQYPCSHTWTLSLLQKKGRSKFLVVIEAVPDVDLHSVCLMFCHGTWLFRAPYPIMTDR
jgi:hypothetical protein